MFYTNSNGCSFRKVEECDLHLLQDLKNSSWDSTVQLACLNYLDQKRWLEKISADSKSLYLIIENRELAAMKISSKASDDDRVIYGDTIGFWGITDIDHQNGSCSFSHGIYSHFRGQGFGKKSLKAGIDLIFEVFNFNRIETKILENNRAEIKSAVNAGMKLEGTLRKAVFKIGQYQNCLVFGILREEWKKD